MYWGVEVAVGVTTGNNAGKLRLNLVVRDFQQGMSHAQTPTRK